MSNEITNASINEPQLLSLLLLDDEQDILNALKRLLRKEYDIVTFTNGHDALKYLSENPIDIIMSDMRMPEIDGADFLIKSRELHPGAIRLLLTGYSDMDSTIKAINGGGVYTYIGKPWENEELKLTLAKASEHYLLQNKAKQLTEQLATTNSKLESLNQSLEQKVERRTSALEVSKQKLQSTLKIQQELSYDVIDMLSATIEYRTGFTIAHIKRIAVQSREVAMVLELEPIECRRVYLCALLHEIGTVGLKDEVLSNMKLSLDNANPALISHPLIGAEIVSKVKRFSTLITSIKHQNENVDGTGTPDRLVGDNIPIASRIVRVVKDFDFLIAGKQNNKKMSVENAEKWIKGKAWIYYDSAIIDAFTKMFSTRNTNKAHLEYAVGVEILKKGDLLLNDLILSNGKTMLKAGQQINESIIEKLQQYENDNHTKITLFIA